MKIRDRIRELRRIRASELRPHPKNWRTHPAEQREALQGLLAEIGYADALLARELPDGSVQLIDGHLRAETTPDQEVPVLLVDLNDSEAAKLLALHDPLAALAEADQAILAQLADEIETDSDAVRQVLEGLLATEKPADESPDGTLPDEVEVPESFQVVVECDDESQQQTVYQRMIGEGYKCRLLNL